MLCALGWDCVMLALALQNVRRTHPVLRGLAGSPLLWCVLASLVLVVSALNGSATSLRDWLGDTDDAVRLVSVRELLAGAPWFDTTLPRIGAPEPLVSHWSRLIDLPLATGMLVLTPVLGPDNAELATRVIWPVLLFFALLLILVRETSRQDGRWATAIAVVLALTSVMAVVQFRPGRVDHHNAMILCAVGGLLLLVRSLEDPRAGWAAGALLGLGFAVGYEAIALVVPALGLAALTAVWQPRYAPGVMRATGGAIAVIAAAILLTIPPTRWLDIHCDALSLNLPVMAACCALGLWGTLAFPSRLVARVSLLCIGTAIGVVFFAALEPACLAGPFGQVDPALKPIWLDQVMETKSVVWLTSEHPSLGLAYVAFVLAGTAAQIARWRTQRHLPTAIATAIVVLAALLGCWQIKLMPYACWLMVVPLARFCAGLQGAFSISAPVVRIAAVVLLSQATLETGFAVAGLPLRGSAATIDKYTGARPPCAQSSNIHRLGALPPGLIAADIDLGPFIVANSPHRVVAAPYHRLTKGIIENQTILGGSSNQSLAEIRALGVDYVVLCPDLTAPRPEDGSLRARLLRGERLPSLQELELPLSAAIRGWRVLPAR